MAAAERLMGVGVPNEVAIRTGWYIQSPITDVESRTLQGPGNHIIVVGSASASVILGSNFDLGDQVLVCSRGVAVSLYPDSASYIWPTSAGAAHAVSADVTRMFVKVDASVWHAVSSV